MNAWLSICVDAGVQDDTLGTSMIPTGKHEAMSLSVLLIAA